MIISNLVRCRTFYLQLVAVSGESLKHIASATNLDHQAVVLMAGQGDLRAESATIELKTGELNDISMLAGQDLEFTPSTETAMWASFLPVNDGSRLKIRVVNTALIEQLRDEVYDTFVVPMSGSIEINGYKLGVGQSARLPITKTGNLIVPEGSICAIVKTIF